jgi:hypothetical protein
MSPKGPYNLVTLFGYFKDDGSAPNVGKKTLKQSVIVVKYGKLLQYGKLVANSCFIVNS